MIVATAAVRTDALPGALDPSFGFAGKVLSAFNAEGVAVALDHLDRIVMVGTRKVNGRSQIVVARFNTTGVSLDLGFGTGGVAIGSFGSNADNVAAAVAIDAANRVIVAGFTTADGGDKDFLVARYTSQGVLDATFNPTDHIGWRAYGFGGEEEARAMAVDSLGRIVVVGQRFGDQGGCDIFCTPGFDFAVLRINPNGDPDSSFDGDGKRTVDRHDLDQATGVAIDQQDRIVLVGASLQEDHGAKVEVMRFKTNGDLDGSFDGDGKKSFGFGNKHFSAAAAVAIDRFGGVIVGGVVADDHANGPFNPLEQNFLSTADFALARLNTDGSLDATFGNAGTGFAQFVDAGAFDDIPRAIAIEPSGRILLAGSATNQTSHEDFALVRYTANGILDSHYGLNGVATTGFTHSVGPGVDQVRGLAFDSEGRTVAGGISTAEVGVSFFALARYQAEHPDYRISPVGAVTLPVNGSGTTTLTLNSLEGWDEHVQVTVAGQQDGGPLPVGMSVSFDGGGNFVDLVPRPYESVSTAVSVRADAFVTPGQYALWAIPAPDSGGHPHEVVFVANVTMSFSAMAGVVDTFEVAGAIDNSGIASALTGKLGSAQAAIDAGDVKSAGNTISALINQVKAQSGKHIATAATINGVTFSPPNVLIADARDLLAQLKTDGVENPVLGYVTTSTNGEVRGAVVSILDSTDTVVASTLTDTTGFYYFANTAALTPGGQYKARVAGMPNPYSSSTPTTRTFTWSSAAISLPAFVLQ